MNGIFGVFYKTKDIPTKIFYAENRTTKNQKLRKDKKYLFPADLLQQL